MYKLRSGRLGVLALIIIASIAAVLIFSVSSAKEKSSWPADLNNNGTREDYSLSREQVTVREGGQTIWQSPEEWQIDQILIGDVTNDSRQELVMLLRKQGSYGPSRPFWAKEADTGWSSHLFVYTLAEDQVRQVWCSSAISEPFHDLQLKTDPQDGSNYLSARKNGFGLNRQIYMKWDQWGFTYER